MKFRLNSERRIKALTAEQFETELATLKENSEVDYIEVGIVSGEYNNIRYYAIDSEGVDVIEPSLEDFWNFWDIEFDSEIVE